MFGGSPRQGACQSLGTCRPFVLYVAPKSTLSKCCLTQIPFFPPETRLASQVKLSVHHTIDSPNQESVNLGDVQFLDSEAIMHAHGKCWEFYIIIYGGEQKRFQHNEPRLSQAHSGLTLQPVI